MLSHQLTGHKIYVLKLVLAGLSFLVITHWILFKPLTGIPMIIHLTKRSLGGGGGGGVLCGGRWRCELVSLRPLFRPSIPHSMSTL